MYLREKAVEYAYKWWNERNPQFYNFDGLGGDCTNFVSQCLYAGGISMNFALYGWSYRNLNSRAPAWTGVDEFFDFATKNTQTLGVRAKEVDIFQMEVGDVVQMKLKEEDGFHHTMLITEIVGAKNLRNILITAHTFDVKNKPLGAYPFEDIRFLKILN